MAETFSRFDSADYLQNEGDRAAYLEAVAEENDPAAMAMALGTIARAQNMSELARKAGLSREGLNKALGPNGNPTLATVMKVAEALGLQIVFRPKVVV